MANFFGTRRRDEIDLRFEGEAAFVYADEGDDWVLGTAYDDSLNGAQGDDEIHGLGGWDVIDGGSGDDLLFGGTGLDIIFGGSGNDRIYGGSAYDELFGDSGNDVIYGGDGGDRLRGDSGDDRLYGGNHSDTLQGSEGDDELHGGDGDDQLWGDEDWDALYGGAGNDRLDGGSWSDTLDGGRGHDTLTGGSGHDRFVFSAADMATASIRIGTYPFARTISYEYFETDTITDFQIGFADRIDLSSLIASETSFAGSTAADAVAQGYIYWQPSAAGTTVYVDRNGGAHNPNGLFGTGDLAIVDLAGITAGQLNDTYFIV